LVVSPTPETYPLSLHDALPIFDGLEPLPQLDGRLGVGRELRAAPELRQRQLALLERVVEVGLLRLEIRVHLPSPHGPGHRYGLSVTEVTWPGPHGRGGPGPVVTGRRP